MRSDAQEKRQALLTAAKELISSHGAEIPLSRVAEGAGVGIGTLYRHFPTREDLLLAVASENIRGAFELIEAHVAAFDEDPEQHWYDLVHALAQRRPGALAAEIVGYFDGELPQARVLAIRDEMLSGLAAALTKAKAAGLVRADTQAVDFQLGLATMTRPLPIWIDRDPLEWMLNTFLRGLQPE